MYVPHDHREQSLSTLAPQGNLPAIYLIMITTEISLKPHLSCTRLWSVEWFMFDHKPA